MIIQLTKNKFFHSITCVLSFSWNSSAFETCEGAIFELSEDSSTTDCVGFAVVAAIVLVRPSVLIAPVVAAVVVVILVVEAGEVIPAAAKPEFQH